MRWPYVEKRMGSRLRNLKKSNKGIGGKGAGKLTDKVIGELTTYYGLAIRRHPHSISEMKKAIWATYHHKSSTDENPQHIYCPPGSDSWCKWRRAEANGTLNSYTHEQAPLNDKILQLLKPIYEILSDDQLLERCLGAETQNNNESLNSLIWTFAPKHLHSGRKIIEIATFIAVSIFNQGFLPILKILSVMGVTIGQQAHMYANSRDEARIDRSERRSTDAVKQARIDHREERSIEQEFFEQEEGPQYGPGLAD